MVLSSRKTRPRPCGDSTGDASKRRRWGGVSTLCTARHPALCTALDVLRSAYRAAAYDRRFTRVEPNCSPTGLLPLTAVLLLLPLHHSPDTTSPVAPHTRVAISRKTPLALLFNFVSLDSAVSACSRGRGGPTTMVISPMRGARASLFRAHAPGRAFCELGSPFLHTVRSCSVTAARPCSLLVLRRLVLVLRRLVLVLRRLVLVLRRLVLVLRRLVLVFAISDSSPTRALYAMGHPAPAPAPRLKLSMPWAIPPPPPPPPVPEARARLKPWQGQIALRLGPPARHPRAAPPHRRGER